MPDFDFDNRYFQDKASSLDDLCSVRLAALKSTEGMIGLRAEVTFEPGDTEVSGTWYSFGFERAYIKISLRGANVAPGTGDQIPANVVITHRESNEQATSQVSKGGFGIAAACAGLLPNFKVSAEAGHNRSAEDTKTQAEASEGRIPVYVLWQMPNERWRFEAWETLHYLLDGRMCGHERPLCTIQEHRGKRQVTARISAKTKDMRAYRQTDGLSRRPGRNNDNCNAVATALFKRAIVRSERKDTNDPAPDSELTLAAARLVSQDDT